MLVVREIGLEPLLPRPGHPDDAVGRRERRVEHGRVALHGPPLDHVRRHPDEVGARPLHRLVLPLDGRAEGAPAEDGQAPGAASGSQRLGRQQEDVAHVGGRADLVFPPVVALGVQPGPGVEPPLDGTEVRRGAWAVHRVGAGDRPEPFEVDHRRPLAGAPVGVVDARPRPVRLLRVHQATGLRGNLRGLGVIRREGLDEPGADGRQLRQTVFRGRSGRGRLSPGRRGAHGERQQDTRGTDELDGRSTCVAGGRRIGRTGLLARGRPAGRGGERGAGHGVSARRRARARATTPGRVGATLTVSAGSVSWS